MKKIKLIVIGLFVAIVPFSSLLAIENESGNYKNKNGIIMTENQYNEFISLFGELSVEYMTEERFNILTNEKYQLVNKDEKYIKTSIKTNYLGKILEYKEDTITEEEYDTENNISLLSNCTISTEVQPITSDCWETSSKRLSMLRYFNSDTQRYYIILTATWKSIPKVRSWDVIGMRHDNNYTLATDTIQAQRIYMNLGKQNYIRLNGGGAKILNNGFGLAVELPKVGSATNIQFDLGAEMKLNSSIRATIYGAYQHAINEVSYADANNYVISSVGKGGVFLFGGLTVHSLNSSYDNMQGVGV